MLDDNTQAKTHTHSKGSVCVFLVIVCFLFDFFYKSLRPDDSGSWAMTNKMVPGGLIDGPIYLTIYRKLLGLKLLEADEFAPFQNDFVIYHDDVGDYSTNEPTMDGTAGSMVMMGHWSPDVK